MRFLSVCSGIEAASAAWQPLGWRAVAFSEIEPFPCAVLAHHYPTVPNWGDMLRFKEWPDAGIDVLVGGTPCQSFSVAGLRKGLDDPRGNLMLTYLAIADRYRPRWVVWENVPGVLSSNRGRDFGTFLGGLGELGYGFAYRILDAQFCGVPQRRRRVFVVGCLGDWRRAAAVLFERHSLQGNPAPRREKGERVAESVVAGTLDSRHAGGFQTAQSAAANHLVAFDLRNVTSVGNRSNPQEGDPCHTLHKQAADSVITLAIRGRGDSSDLECRTDGTANALLTPNGGRGGIGVGAIAFDCKASGQAGFGVGDIASTMRGMGHTASHQNGGGHQAAMVGMQVRRLTPRECERLQGFPDSYTDVPYRSKCAADGPRYKSLGNSMAVPVIRWIGERINAVAQVITELAA